MSLEKQLEKSPEKAPNIYITGLPSLGSEDLALYSTLHNARVDLVTQLVGKDYRVRNIDGHRPWLKTMLQQASESDAFVFAPLSLPENHPRFQSEAAQRWFEFFSIITGVHVGSREKYGATGVSKPCIMLEPDLQGRLAIGLLKDLYEKQMFSSDVDDIVRVAHGDAQRPYDFHALNRNGVTALSDILCRQIGMPQKSVHSKYPPEHFFEPMRKDINRHRFGIALFGSATTQEAAYKQGAYKLAEMAGERGWRMLTGAGVDGCMGAADEGFEAGRNKFNLRYPNALYKPAHVGVSTQAILRLEGPPRHVDQLIITEDIYDRIKVIIRGQKSSDELQRARDTMKVAFVAPGGTGTLHELATMMQLATNGNMMDDRVVVLLNPPSHIDKHKGFWDPLIDTAKQLGFATRFEVAATPEAAIAIADREYVKWLERNPELKALPHPVLNPNPLSLPRSGGNSALQV